MSSSAIWLVPCPWHSFVVLSIKKGAFDHANSFLPNFDQTEALKQHLEF